MKKPYQIGAGRAVQRVRQWAEEKNPNGAAHAADDRDSGTGQARCGRVGAGRGGLRVILLAIQQEADAMTGARHEHGPDRQALRWSREDGFVVVDGQKVPIERRLMAQQEWRRSSTGHLRTVPANPHSGGRSLVEDAAGADHTELPAGDAQLCPSLWHREIRHQ